MAAIEQLEVLHQVAVSVNHPETISPRHVMDIDQTAHRDIVSAQVEPQVARSLNDSIATGVEKKLVNTIQLATYSVNSQKSRALMDLLMF